MINNSAPKTRVYLLVSFISLMLISNFQNVKAAEQSNTLFRLCRGNTDFLPFMNLKGTGRWQLLLKKAAANLPIEIVTHSIPRSRCVIEVMNNDLSDGFFTEPTTDLLSSVSFPTNSKNEIDNNYLIEKVQYVVVTNSNSSLTWDGSRFTDLKNKVIGVQRGRKYVTDILDKMKVPYDVSLIEQNLDKLKRNRIAAVILEIQQYEELKKQHPHYDFKIFPIQFHSFDIYLGVATPYYLKNKELVQKLWHNLKVLSKYAN